MDLELSGRKALVTGGSRGIGRATAVALSREGVRVAIAAREAGALDEATREIEAATGARPFAVRADCTRPADVTAMMASVADTFGGLDILVNSVGAARGGHFVDLREEDWAESIASKLMGEIRCCREALPLLRKSGAGVIINVTGQRGKQPDALALPASVTNAGLANFIVGLAQAEASRGVRVVGVSPGPVETRRIHGIFETEARLAGVSVQTVRERWVASVPLGRIARVEEVADVIVFLASPRAGFISGTTIQVDGAGMRGV
ncbi:MAG TPA: SDR family oxidoreductase [Methylomirabilota bacterium]|nr:SDR family oxidoreductase [Methylomirabilota bacterium]